MQTYKYPQILDSALDAVGNTPLIRLDRLASEEGLKCNLCLYTSHLTRKQPDAGFLVVGKVEFLSAGGSVKDRIAKGMVLAAEGDGKLIPGKSVVIEPTSGNTGTSILPTLLVCICELVDLVQA